MVKVKDKDCVRELSPREKDFRRYYKMRNLIAWLCIVIIALMGYYINLFSAFLCSIFCLSNFAWFEDGATEKCVNKDRFLSPKDGFKRMLIRFPWFVISSGIIYVFCKNCMPWLF